jgi:hypothetical protein
MSAVENVSLSPALPEITPEIFTTATAIVGVRGSGKTSTGVVLNEEAIRFGVPVAIIDPGSVGHAVDALLGAAGQIPAAVAPIVDAMRTTQPPIPARPRPVAPREPRRPTEAPPPRREAAPRAAIASDGPKVGGGEQKLLDALAQLEPAAGSKLQIGLLAGYSPRSSTFDTYVARLRAARLIEPAGGGLYRLTDDGHARTNAQPPRTTAETIAFWLSKIGGGEGKLLQVLIDAHPAEVSREALAAKSGYSATSSTFDTYVARLRASGLATTRPGYVCATDALFPTGAPR